MIFVVQKRGGGTQDGEETHLDPEDGLVGVEFPALAVLGDAEVAGVEHEDAGDAVDGVGHHQGLGLLLGELGLDEELLGGEGASDEHETEVVAVGGEGGRDGGNRGVGCLGHGEGGEDGERSEREGSVALLANRLRFELGLRLDDAAGGRADGAGGRADSDRARARPLERVAVRAGRASVGLKVMAAMVLASRSVRMTSHDPCYPARRATRHVATIPDGDAAYGRFFVPAFSRRPPLLHSARRASVRAPANPPRMGPKKPAKKKKSGGGVKISSQTPIFGSIEDGDREEFDECLAVTPECIHETNKNGWTPLHQAAYSGERDMLDALIKAGGKIDETDHDGDTPVHYAAVQGELDCVLLLAAAGAKLEVKDNDGETP